MTDQQHQPQPADTPPPAPAPRRRWLIPAASGLTGAILGAGTVGAIWASGITEPDKPQTFTLAGKFTLTDVDDDGYGGCEPTDGYDDITTGTAVTVYDAEGAVVATGELGPPTSDAPDGIVLGCDFPVRVPDVPRGSRHYQVEVSHRGRVTVSAKDAEAGKFAVTLG